VEAVGHVREEIAARRTRGELAESFYRAELAPLGERAALPSGGTVIVVAKPRPASRVVFDLEEGSLDALLPPTYFRYRSTFEDLRRDLEAHALPGVPIDHLGEPLKSVAARLGLVRYGRNNVSYVPGAGSYVQLCGYVTEAQLAPSAGGEGVPRLLDECEGCSICQKACPTRAITADRVLIRAERCLTLLNENPGVWPDWVPASAHRCLLGCLSCQRSCPANARLPVEETGLRFSSRETQELLNGHREGDERAESGVRAKLAWLGQSNAEPVLGRNLQALIEARRRRIRSRGPRAQQAGSSATSGPLTGCARRDRACRTG